MGSHVYILIALKKKTGGGFVREADKGTRIMAGGEQGSRMEMLVLMVSFKK